MRNIGGNVLNKKALYLSDFPKGLFLLNGTNIIACNNTGANLFGYDNEKDLLGKDFFDFCNENLFYNKETFEEASLESNNVCEFINKEGRIFLGRVDIAKTAGSCAIIISGIEDEIVCQKYFDIFYNIIEKNTEGILILDMNGEVNWLNSAFTKLTGYTIEEFNIDHIKKIKNTQNQQNFYKDIVLSINNYGEWKGELFIHVKSGDLLPIYASIYIIQDDGMSPAQIVAIIYDISHIKNNQDKISQLAYFDDLTGLYNRTYLMNQIDIELKKAERYNEKLALIYFDLDGFKNINDTQGHYAGDVMLKSFANALKSSVRDMDIVARQGGDEFVCILPRIQDESDTYKVIERLATHLKKPVIFAEQEFFMCFSAGISVFPEDASTSEELINNGDIAMYNAKRSIGSVGIRYNPQMKYEINEQFKIVTHLRKAIERNEFSLYFQPIVNLMTGEIESAEAFLRWSHPVYGDISPYKFIPIAETHGQIQEIGKWVLSEVCKVNKMLQDKGCKKIPISVNVSVKQLEQSDFVQMIKDIINETGLETRFLEIEIIENFTVNRINDTINILKELKDLGVNIAIDDFGTGYSFLGQIKKLSINKLKIDKIFIEDISTETDAEIVSTIIGMAKSLQLKVVAEGIETMEQLRILKDKKCIFGQGFLFSEPVSIEVFEQQLIDGIIIPR